MTALTATGGLIRLALLRDRVRLPAWVIGIAALLAGTASGVAGLYPTEAERVQNAAVRAGSVVTRAFTGPATGGGAGALAMSEALVFTCVVAALLNILLVVRHTRQNEELGRAELVGSAAVGRQASLAAALVLAAIADAGIAAACWLGLLTIGLPGGGSLVAGVAVGAAGAAFAGITAICVQVAEGARGAIGLASIVLGLAFLLRAAGDALGDVGASGLTVTPAWPSWCSPIGWAQQLLPFGAHRWWPLALIAGLCGLTIAVATVLRTHRDVGTGMMPVRRGRAAAVPSLRGPFALVWRLQRGLLLGWVAGNVVFGAVFGGIGTKIDEFFGSGESAEVMRELGGGGSLADAYFATVIGLLAVMIAGYTVQVLLRLRADEVGGAAEVMLATAVSRSRWLLAYATCAVLGTALILAALGASTGLAYGLVTGDIGGALTGLLPTALAQLAPTLVLAGFVLAVFGVVPRYAATLSWLALAICLVIGQFGGLLGLPRIALDLSPFSHLPDLPAEPLAALPLVIMLALAAALGGVGVACLRRRSLAM